MCERSKHTDLDEYTVTISSEQTVSKEEVLANLLWRLWQQETQEGAEPYAS